MSTVTAVPLRPVKRGYLIWLWVGIAVALIAAFLLATRGEPALAREMRSSAVTTTASGLKYRVTTPGHGAHPTDSDVALVMYEGRLLTGTTFDKSQQPTPMPVTGVVPGFSEALKLMSRGEKARFWLPPALAYGPDGKGPIPPNAMLVFDVQLLDFIPQQVLQQMQMQQMMRQQGAGGAAPGTGLPGGIVPGGGAPGGAGGLPPQ